jgi:class 3 adenylate cyclase
MGNLRTDFEVSLKQTEVDLLNQEKRNQKNIRIAMTIILGLVLIILITLIWYSRNISKQKKVADELLLNILPTETAAELKGFGKVQAKRFESITVLFTDFKGFTKHSENLSPEELVESVDFYFSKFDEIIEKYGLEKIKTIGDAYMCAGGLPFQTKDHAIKIMLAAFEIVEFVTHAINNNEQNKMRFEIRIGVNSGPVVAGVVGTKKFAYDIWGDTVNVASRMESNSEPGKINISESTYELVKDIFDCQYRGEIEVKNKGALKMYFANSISKKWLN